jgi:hypothetical protein
VKRQKRRTEVLCLRLTAAEMEAVKAECRPDELLSECARRLLLGRIRTPDPQK